MLGEIAQLVKQMSCYAAALEVMVQQKDAEIKSLKAEVEKLTPKADKKA